MVTRERDAISLWTKNFITITIVNFLIFFGFQMLMPTLPIYVKNIGGDSSVIGLINGIFTISALLTRPLSGILLDKIGRRKIFLVGLAIFIIAVLSYSWLSTVSLILLFRLIHGFGWGASSTAASTIATDNIPKERFGEGIGYFSLSSSLAMAVGPAVGLYITANHSFSILFFIATLLPILSFLLSFTLKYEEASKEDLSKEPRLLFEKSSLIPSIIVFFITISYGTLVSFLSLYALERGIENIGSFFTIYATSLIVSRPIFGKIVDNFGLDFAVIPGFLSIFAAMVLLSRATSLPIFLLVALIYGVGFGAAQSSLQTMAIINSSNKRYGAANATFFTGFDAGIGFGSIVFGIIASKSGYSQMYLLTTVVILISFGIYLILGRKSQIKSS